MSEEANTNLKGNINYLYLRQVIFDYFKETQGVKLGSYSIDYLKEELANGRTNGHFFTRNDENKI